MPSVNRYDWTIDILPFLKKVAKLIRSDEKTNKDKQIYEAFYSYQSDNVIKKRKVTTVIQVNFIRADNDERHENGFIYQDTLEKIAEKFSIDFRDIINKNF